MVKKLTLFRLLAVLILLFFTACKSEKGTKALDGERTYADYVNVGARIAVQAGDVYADVARDLFKAKETPEYLSVADMLEELRKGRVDAALLSHGYVRQLIDSGMYPNFDYLWLPKNVYVNEAAPIFHTEELRDQYNDWFRGIVANGTWDEVVSRWIGAPLPKQEDIPKFELTGKNGTLKMCDTGNYPPLIYFDANGEPAGYDVEMMSRFAQHMGMKLEITMMSYEAIVPYVVSGKADMSSCTLTITNGRTDSIIFGEPSVITQAVLIVPKGDKPASDYAYFNGKKIAVITGVLTYLTTEKIGGVPVYYSDSSAAAEDVRQGRADGFMHAMSTVRVMASELGNDVFEAVAVPKEIFSAQIGGISLDQTVIDRFNAFLDVIKTDGTLADMQDRWFGESLDLNAPMPEIRNTGGNGILKVATCADSLPYVYTGSDGGLKGFSVELVLRFGAYEGKVVEFADMEFGGLIPYIISKKADIGVANMAITEERKKSVLFTDPFFDEQHGILVLKQGKGAVAGKGNLLDFSDFMGKRIGAVTGNLSGQVISDHLGVAPVYYSEQSAGIEDVRKGRINGFMTDLSILRVIAGSSGGEDMYVVPVPAEIFAGPLGAFSMNQDIIERFNAFLRKLKNDGMLADMQNRWLENAPDSDTPMPDIAPTGENGALVVATSGMQLPFSYYGANGKLKGYSVELAMRFAAYEGMNITFAAMDFSGLIPYVASGKADFGIDAVTITEERKKSVLFTDSIYDDLLGIITLKRDGKASADSFTLTYADFAGKRVGVEPGAVFDQVTLKIDGKPIYYNEMSAAIEDMRKNRIDGFMTDMSIARVFTEMPDNADIHIVEVPSEIFAAPMAAISMEQDVIDRFDAFLSEIEADGVLADMQNRWLSPAPNLDAPMPDIPLTGKNGTLTVATSGLATPYSFVGKNNELKGYCVELGLRFAAREGMNIEFATMDFAGFIPYVVSKKADIGIDALYITEERKKSVIFSNPYAEDYVAILVKKGGAAATISSFDYTYFEGKKMGIVTGTAVDKPAEEILKAIPVYYLDTASVIEDLKNSKIDGFIYDLPTMRIIAGFPGNENLQYIEAPSELFFAPLGAVSSNQNMIDRFNAFLNAIKSDGTLTDMHDRWLETMSALAAPMPEIPISGENGVLRIVVDDAAQPFAYRGADGELRGFCVELGKRFAAYERMDVEFIPMDFGALIPYVGNGKADLGIDAIVITEERKETILFTDSFYDCPLAILALRKESVPSVKVSIGFIEWLKTGAERNLITDNRWKMIVNGLGVTMIISFAAQIFGTIFGCFICFILMRRSKFAKWIGNLYCGLIYGTPVVVLLMITYYIVFGSANISNILVAIAAFTMIMGANIAQNLKGAIDTVDPVEVEAARSIGFSAFRAFTAVTLPQAVRRVLPAYTNGFVELVKATAIVGYIAIQDLTRAGDIIRSRTYDAYFPLLFVALIYLIVTAVCVQLFKLIVKKINDGGAV